MDITTPTTPMEGNKVIYTSFNDWCRHGNLKEDNGTHSAEQDRRPFIDAQEELNDKFWMNEIPEMEFVHESTVIAKKMYELESEFPTMCWICRSGMQGMRNKALSLVPILASCRMLEGEVIVLLDAPEDHETDEEYSKDQLIEESYPEDQYYNSDEDDKLLTDTEQAADGIMKLEDPKAGTKKRKRTFSFQ